MIGKTIFENLKERFKGEGAFRILFCPYKQEMWDSMETIFTSATNDEETEVGIMPIPYFTLQNLMPVEALIEFGDYAKNFPMALNERWDVILFHYPYDNLNNVTRPMVYSSHLKMFCKHLVLVHYACMGDRDIEDKEALYSGVKNSDLVVFETEQQAEHANRVLKAFCNWQGEAVAWGSAKYDLVGKLKCPKEWQDIIKGRKTVLLQTSIIPFMNNPNKIKQIRGILEENKDKCIIWRPHPLMEATILAHRPQDINDYYKLVDDFLNTDNIFDNTSTAEIAISVADEMISDRSSLVTLWKATGKKLTMMEE
jgi:hypothetical protein